MKKFIAITFIAAFAVFGSSTASADELGIVGEDPRETECAEADTRPTDLNCEEIIDEETGDLIYPPVGGTGGTLPDPTTTLAKPPADLPATGSSGSIGLVQIGGLMLAGGLLVVVAARRRAPAPTA